MRIIELQSENFKRLSAVTIRPDRSLVIVAGENDQGKSSTLDSIAATLGGAALAPAEPIRRGKRRARTRVDLGELVVERRYSPKGTELVVTNAQGVPQKSPQGLLDDLCGRLAFDPQGFDRRKKPERLVLLKSLAGLDFTELDARRAAAYQRRTDTSRDVKRLEAQLDGLELHQDAPAAEVSTAELIQELERRQAEIALNTERRDEVTGAEHDVTKCRSELAQWEARIAALEEELRAARVSLEEWKVELSGCEKHRDAMVAVVAGLVDPDLEEVKAQIASSGATNRRVRANAEHARVSAELAARQGEVEELTDTIDDVDAEKRRLVSEAHFPIEGLGFDEDGVTLNGVAWEQASESQRLLASVAVGAALHPKLEVLLVRNGNDLGEKKLAELSEIADRLGLQIWLERIAGGPGALVIEDGAVRGQESIDEAANG